MKFDMVFSNEDAARAKAVPMTAEMLASATYEGLFAALAFHDSFLKPLAHGTLRPTPRENCLIGLHYRIVAFLTSTRQICGPQHFQTLSSIARSVFEVGLDIALVRKDPTNESAEKLEAFGRYERMRLARKRVDYFASHPIPADLDLSLDQALVSNAAEVAPVDALRTKHWGTAYFDNWYGKKTYPRCQDAGTPWEDRYLRYYGALSWHVHGGLHGVGGVTNDVANGICGQAYLVIASVALDSFEAVADVLQWRNAIAGYESKIEFLRSVPALWLTDLRLRSQGAAARFDFLEPAERERWGLSAPRPAPGT